MPNARADIYTWTDAGGRVNISNVSPPDGVKVTSIVRETPKPAAARPLPDSMPQTEVQALAERVRQLESEMDLARRQPPPIAYSAPAPPTIIYAAPPPSQPTVQYADLPQPVPTSNYGCDLSWFGCGLFWSPFAYPTSVVVVRGLGLHRAGAFHGIHRGHAPQPMRPPGPPGRSPGGPHRR